MAADLQQRREVHYQGRVQGVGFRYSVARIAQRYAVVGFVQNLPDGRVKLVAEGGTKEVRQFLEDISAAMEGYILQTHEDTKPATGEFFQFEVRH